MVPGKSADLFGAICPDVLASCFRRVGVFGHAFTGRIATVGRCRSALGDSVHPVDTSTYSVFSDITGHLAGG
jgi:hypothetical protein